MMKSLSLAAALFLSFSAFAIAPSSPKKSDADVAYELNGRFYCKRVNFDKYRRCDRSTGQCFGEEFETLAQCQNALP